ncbi:TonB-dependent receptor [Marinilongibacter aquaticus]|uniref:SusC/RagA family TonB-linked outer membrane protein n=1 Tax=Marinilongibacter aquaticus TaxID=2975157 RepID=UPI0021BD2AA3|nr:TonB-dependent receptor [Marinilongibacter aquaticus]UBM59023.1 TonB-dependent receptor [Marinilongibacter aquaticus]
MIYLNKFWDRRGAVLLSVFILSFLVSMNLYAQGGTVKGHVFSASDSSPLTGVTVTVKGTTKGTISDENGAFELPGVSSGAVLVFSSIGYVSQEIKLNGQTDLRVSLEDNDQALSEVVVVGYGTQKKSSVTGAVTSLKTKDITSLPVISPSQAMQGKVPGVSIVNNSSPGQEPTVRVRGYGSITLNPNPLYVVDGIPTTGMNNFDPKDIESMEVLKDASATAIYGSRAANGVIIITTKKGSKNGKLNVSASSYYGTQSVWRKLDLLNRDQYIQYGTALLTNAGGTAPPRFSAMDSPVYDGASTTFAQTDTDWQDVMFRNAAISNNQVSLNGGNNVSKFYASVGYFKQDGITPYTGYDRKSFRVNSEHEATKFLTLGQTLVMSSGFTQQEAGAGSGSRSLLMNILRMTPYFPVHDPTLLGGFSSTSNGLDGTDPDNPMRIVTLDQQDTYTKDLKLMGTLYARVKLTDWLSYQFTFGGDYSNRNYSQFLPIYVANVSRPNATINKQNTQYFSKVYTNMLSAKKSFGKHDIDFTGVIEKQSTSVNTLNAQGNRPDNNVKELAGVSSPTTSSSLSQNNIISYVGRLNYEYDEKYLIGLSVRRDGSSKFAPGNKWGTFPSASVGWRISEENFMKSITAINELKIRGSWGKVGFNSLGDYVWQPLIQANNTIYPFGNNTTNLGSYFNQLGNTDLSWEVTDMKNIGLDMSLFNNKIFFSLDLYKRNTDGLILSVPVANSLGFANSPLANVGSMMNKGLEFQGGYNHSGKDFNWTLSATFDMTRNEVLSLESPNGVINAGLNADFGGFNITRTEAGHPIQSFYGWKTDGIFQSQEEIEAANALDGDPTTKYQPNAEPGDIRFKDLNNDGKVDDQDTDYIGSFIPKFTYGLNWGGNYKNLDFSIFFQGVQGNKIYNGTKVIGQGMLRLFNSTTDVLNAWTPTNTDTDVPRAVNSDPNQNTRTSDRFVEDGSYLRLKTVTVGYTLPETWTQHITGNYLNKVRFYISSNNLLTFTKYTGYDPEVASKDPTSSTGLLTNGVDYVQYPQTRTVLVGVNLNF